MKIAFATNDGLAVNTHFGHAVRFDIYDIQPVAYRLVESRMVNSEDKRDRIDARVQTVVDCKMVFMNEIGGNAAARVTNARIHPVKVPYGDSVKTLIEQLQQSFNRTPAPWLRRILNEETVRG